MKRTATAIAFPLAACICFLTFTVLRGIQLNQPDSYNTPYTNISTGFMAAFTLAWLATPISAFLLRRTAAVPALVFAWLVFALGALWVGFFLICMFRFMFP